jgi:hypothetical protein
MINCSRVKTLGQCGHWQKTLLNVLGYTPKARVISSEENSITLLAVYKKLVYQAAKQHLQQNPVKHQELLIIMHAILSFMKMEIMQGTDLSLLADSANEV